MSGFSDLFNSEELSDVILHLSTKETTTAAPTDDDKSGDQSGGSSEVRWYCRWLKGRRGEMGKKGAEEPEPEVFIRTFSTHAMILYQSAYFKVGH